MSGDVTEIQNVTMREVLNTGTVSGGNTPSENTTSENTASENTTSENTPSENTPSANVIDYETDTDGDGIPDAYEDIYGTDKYKVDTDDDGISDYYELYLTMTDPLVYDSVTAGVADGDLDSDADALDRFLDDATSTSSSISEFQEN